MPTFIKTGFWEKAKKGYANYLNLDDLIAQQSVPGSVGPQGPTGAQGIQGNTGEVGPAGVTGLNWRGNWSAGTAYLANDAVGYNGASYFRLISGTTPGLPNVDTTNWALLASQGAVGPTGSQGPTGAQGTSGTQTLQQVLTTGDTYTDGTYTTRIVQGAVLVSDNFSNTSVTLEFGDISFAKGSSYSILKTAPVTVPRTITLPDASGTVALVSVNTTENLSSSTGSAPFPYSNSNFAKFTTGSSYALPIAILGDVKYVLTTSAATLWASPNPGNDGANNNFITPDGNGNSYISLLPNKSYKFTYIGRYGGTYGYWTYEIMNP